MLQRAGHTLGEPGAVVAIAFQPAVGTGGQGGELPAVLVLDPAVPQETGPVADVVEQSPLAGGLVVRLGLLDHLLHQAVDAAEPGRPPVGGEVDDLEQPQADQVVD